MIVKNESAVIRRCIESVRPLITHWVIVDTGSTDGTQQIIQDCLQDIPGALYERPWQDFAHNRSEALSLARPKAAFSLIIDADDALEIPDGFIMPELIEDCYMMEIRDAPVLYWRKQLVSNRLTWRYRGVLHEFVDSIEPHSTSTLPIGMRRNHDGARRKAADWFRKDVAVLEEALAVEIDPFLVSRYTFYLAQSYRDSGLSDKAIEFYTKRSKQGGWQEEVYFSLYQSAKLMETLGYDESQILDTYHAATEINPKRIEALHGASRYCRMHGLSDTGYELAKIGLGSKLPEDALFAEPWIYDFGLADEFCICAYWSGHHDESISVGLSLLQNAKLPEDERPRVTQNIRESWNAIAHDRKPPNLGTFGKDDFVAQHGRSVESVELPMMSDAPKVLMAVFIDGHAPYLALHLECLEQLDYPKSRIVLRLHTSIHHKGLLQDWIDRVRPDYHSVAIIFEGEQQVFFESDNRRVEFSDITTARDAFLQETSRQNCDFCFITEANNLLKASTLRALVTLNLPIAAPFLRSADPTLYYANFHAEIDANGFYVDCDQYYWILQRLVRGIIEVPVVNGSYLVRADVAAALSYQDHTGRADYVVFSESARKTGTSQYLDNRIIYGFITSPMGLPKQNVQDAASLSGLLSIPQS